MQVLFSPLWRKPRWQLEIFAFKLISRFQQCNHVAVLSFTLQPVMHFFAFNMCIRHANALAAFLVGCFRTSSDLVSSAIYLAFLKSVVQKPFILEMLVCNQALKTTQPNRVAFLMRKYCTPDYAKNPALVAAAQRTDSNQNGRRR